MISAKFNSISALALFLERLTQYPAVLVTIESTQGSVPREAGAWMAVFADDLFGTIGGGHLEYETTLMARAQLSSLAAERGDDALSPQHRRFALGPSLGQCCGGVVNLSLRRVHASDIPELRARLQPKLHPLALFGGGHVGHALVEVLARLPFSLTWIDSRDGVFDPDIPAHVRCEHSEPVQAAVHSLVPHSLVLIMSFSHAEDLDVVAACLQRQREFSDLPFIGLIGSQTKGATFRHRLAARGFSPAELARVTSPIGIAGISSKAPEVIAVAVAAQLLQTVSVLDAAG